MANLATMMASGTTKDNSHNTKPKAILSSNLMPNRATRTMVCSSHSIRCNSNFEQRNRELDGNSHIKSCNRKETCNHDRNHNSSNQHDSPDGDQLCTMTVSALRITQSDRSGQVVVKNVTACL